MSKPRNLWIVFCLMIFYMATPIWSEDEIFGINPLFDQVNKNLQKATEKLPTPSVEEEEKEESDTNSEKTDAQIILERKSIMGNYLKSRYYGRKISYYDAVDDSYQTGHVVKLIFKGSDTDLRFAFLIYNDKQRQNIEADLTFIKDVYTLLRRDSNPLIRRTNVEGNKFRLGTVQKTAQMAGGILGGGANNASLDTSILDRVTSTTKSDIIDAGLMLKVYDQSEKKEIDSRIIIHQNKLFLFDGTPLTIRPERK